MHVLIIEHFLRLKLKKEKFSLLLFFSQFKMRTRRYVQRIGNENTKDEIRTREQWVLRERFHHRRCPRLCLRKRDTRVPRLWSRGMLSGCIVQRFSLPFRVHGRLADRVRSTLKNMI